MVLTSASNVHVASRRGDQERKLWLYTVNPVWDRWVLSQTGCDDDWAGGQEPRRYYKPKKKVQIPYPRKQVGWEKPVSSIIAHKQETDS